MAFVVRRVDYFSTTATDQSGGGYKLLSALAQLNVNLLAFTAIPVGPMHTQLTLFPEDTDTLARAAEQSGLVLDGPHPALLVQGDDELGALAGIHERLSAANVNVYASTGLANGRGTYAYLLYVRPDEYERAASALNV